MALTMVRGSKNGQAVEHGDPYVIFRVGRQEFALRSGLVLEIRTLPPSRAVSPEGDTPLVGAIALHGQSIPVVDLAQCFQQPVSRRSGRRFAIVLPFVYPDGRRYVVGLVVTAVSSVVHIPAERIGPPGPDAPKASVGRVRINGRFKYLIEPDQILTANELAAALGLLSPTISSVA